MLVKKGHWQLSVRIVGLINPESLSGDRKPCLTEIFPSGRAGQISELLKRKGPSDGEAGIMDGHRFPEQEGGEEPDPQRADDAPFQIGYQKVL